MLTACQRGSDQAIPIEPPNFLFCIADDWSYPHAGAYGDEVASTPHFDRIAREGILFTNAFTASPSCSPSRAAILTGQEMWRLKEGGVLFGALSNEYPVYPAVLQEKNYQTGHTGKGYGPGNLKVGGWTHNPAGPGFQQAEVKVPKAIRATDYAANFKQFMAQRDTSKPFCFWYGASEPHRRYEYGIGAANGFEIDQIKVPAFLPDVPQTRNDVADYYYEVKWFDDHLGRMIKLLEEMDELENTVIVVTSDNGMPFPRAKSNLYNYGVQIPLAIRWGKSKAKVKVVEQPVSLTDIAPTFLDLAGIEVPEEMTGLSLAPVLLGKEERGPRDFVASGLERHTISRPDNKGYPSRAIHTPEYTFIQNFQPNRWPAGDPDFDAWPQGEYGDVDAGVSRTFMLENASEYRDLFHLAFGRRVREEFFHLPSDPFQLKNLAAHPEYQMQKQQLKERLFDYLKATGDPRIKGESPWDQYTFYGGPDWEEGAQEEKLIKN